MIGNDASWMQIAREQVEVLGTSLGTDLRRSDYHKVAEGYGGVGLVLSDPARVDATLAEITKHRGTKFDPQVVDACVRLFREKGYILAP